MVPRKVCRLIDRHGHSLVTLRFEHDFFEIGGTGSPDKYEGNTASFFILPQILRHQPSEIRNQKKRYRDDDDEIEDMFDIDTLSTNTRR